jgi:hypothetical protein
MADEHVDLLEGAFVEEVIDSFSGGQFPLFVLAIDRPPASGMERFLAELS